MGNLSDLFGRPIEAGEVHVASPEQQLREAIESAGLKPPAEIEIDGKLHRFDSHASGHGHRGKRSGWYVAYPDGVQAGAFGCWRAGVAHNWTAEIGRSLTAAEEMARARHLEEARKAREAARAAVREAVEESLQEIWDRAVPASAEHPYLKRKGVLPHGARVTGDGRLVIAMESPSGELQGLQYIEPGGRKQYHPGTSVGGCLLHLGSSDGGPIYVAEGFATAATVAEVMASECVATFSAHNIPAVVESLKAEVGDRAIIVVADNDQSGTGQAYAEQAAAKHGARVVVPPIPGDANDYHQAGHDLRALLEPPKAERPWLVPASELLLEPPPIRWLVKGWLQSNALALAYGASGSAKTFVAIDWACTIASGLGEWLGLRASHGTVVYLAGEGHYGIRQRLAAWCQEHGRTELDLFVSPSGQDITSKEGFLRVAQSIALLDPAPCLIIIDTLHRHMSGDENSGKDIGAMVRACDALREQFGCTVLIIHHSGHSNSDRERGHSSIRGSLDISIQVTRNDADVVTLHQGKAKDAREQPDRYLKMRTVTIGNRVDDDGEPVTSIVLDESTAEAAATETREPTPMRRMERAWWASGTEIEGGDPYVSRSALLDLLTQDGLNHRQSSRQLSPLGKGLISQLLDAGEIEVRAHGWAVIGTASRARLLLQKDP